VPYFNAEFLKNSSLTFAPVPYKFGRLSFDATFLKTIDAIWVGRVWFWSFRFFCKNLKLYLLA
jgi:hypothetical protein